MLHAGLSKKKHATDDDDEQEEKEARREAQHEKNRARKKKLKRDAKEGAKFLPLILEPYRVEECETCGLDAYVPLGVTPGEEKKKKGIKKPTLTRDEKKQRKRERDEEKRRERAAAADAARLAEEELKQQAQRALVFRRLMNGIARDERLALNKEIDGIYHELQRVTLESGETLEALEQAANARRKLIVRLKTFHAAFVAQFANLFDLRPDLLMPHRVTVKQTMGLSVDDLQSVVETLRETMQLLHRAVPDYEPGDAAAVTLGELARPIDDISRYLLRCLSEQRSMVETYDAALVTANAQLLSFPDALGFGSYAQYVQSLNKDYAFVFAYTLTEFLQGLKNAHDLGNPAARRREAERRARNESEMVPEDEEEEFTISEEESTYSGSEEDEEERERKQARRKRAPPPMQRGIARTVKMQLGPKDKERDIMRPIMHDPQGMKDFFNLEATNYLIELTRMVTQLNDVVTPPAFDEYLIALEVFQLTTYVEGPRIAVDPNDWTPYFLEDMIDTLYKDLRVAVKKKQLEDQKARRSRSGKKSATGEEERSTEEDDQSRSVDSTSESEEEGEEDEEDGGMVAEKTPVRVPVKEKRYKDKEAVEKNDSLAGDPAFVRSMASRLFEIVIGRGDHTKERAAWDPRRDTRRDQTVKTQPLRIQTELMKQTRRILDTYEKYVRPDRYYIDAAALEKLINATLQYIESQDQASAKKETKPETMEAEDDEKTTTATSTTKKAAPPKRKSNADTPLDTLTNKVDQLMDQALIYHQIAVSIAQLLDLLQILPGYQLRVQDPFLHWENEREAEESTAEEQDLEDEDYKNSRRVVIHTGQ